MFRSIYNHTSTIPAALSLRVGEQLLFIEQHDAHWWKMQAEDGSIGLVPSCYVKPDMNEMQDAASKNVVLESIERAMEVIHSQAAMNAGQYTAEQRTNLKKLIEHRKAIMKIKGAAADLEGPSTSGDNIPIQPRRSAPTLPDSARRSTKRAAPKAPSGAGQGEVIIPPHFVSSLIEELRMSTGISYNLSFTAAETVISHMRDHLPITAQLMEKILHGLMEEKENDSHTDESLIRTYDGQQIETILESLTEHKDDAQQRSWALGMDEPTISQQLKDLLQLLGDASRRVSRAVFRQDGYQYLQSLVVYYQMEHRPMLRLLLLEVFASLCGVDKGVISQFLCSVLPGELAQAVQTIQDDLELLLKSSLVLTMIFSTGESVPYLMYDNLNEEFIQYLIDQVESAPEGNDGDRIISSFVQLLLSFNQHFADTKENIIMKTLTKRKTAKVVTEQIMLLFNREEDPVIMFNYPKSCQSSVFKMVMDIFSSPWTSGLFFTADMKVMIEIILRQITDLSAGNKARTEYLSLLRLILTNSDYKSHQHMSKDLGVCLKRIGDEETPESIQDKQIVKELLKNFNLR